MMVVEKKQPLEKNRNLLGQKQRKVSKSNKQICSPAYGNGPPLFPTGITKVFRVFLKHFLKISLQNWILLRTLLYPGFRTSKSTHSPQFPIHQNPCNIHPRRYQLNTRTKLRNHIIKFLRQAGKPRCSIREKATNKKLDRGRLHWISLDHLLLASKVLPPPNPRSMEMESHQRLERALVEMLTMTASPWKAWSAFPPPPSRLTTGRDWRTSKPAR